MIKAASELSKEALSDTTNYNALELGHAFAEDIEKELRKCIELHRPIFDEDEFCVGFVIADDPLIKNLKRRKFFASLYLPSPRPSQSIFLYNKPLDRITKRLWILPHAYKMSLLATSAIVPKEYKTMQAWSIAFFKGTFWEYIRYEHDIKMLSEQEYLAANREKLIQAGCKAPPANFTDAFDFSKIHVKQFVDPGVSRATKGIDGGDRKAENGNRSIAQ